MPKNIEAARVYQREYARKYREKHRVYSEQYNHKRRAQESPDHRIYVVQLIKDRDVKIGRESPGCGRISQARTWIGALPDYRILFYARYPLKEMAMDAENNIRTFLGEIGCPRLPFADRPGKLSEHHDPSGNPDFIRLTQIWFTVNGGEIYYP